MRALIPASSRALLAPYYTARQIESALASALGVDTQLVDDGTFFVAELDREAVGCGGWSRRRTPFGGDHAPSRDASLLDPQREPARIRAFFVDPRYARRGIGRSILAACERDARQAGFGSLELVATLGGEPLYAACGFTAGERFDVALEDGAALPVVRMRKRLPLT